MIIAIDVETQSLNTQKFIIGCTKILNKNKYEIHKTKEEMWNYIINKAEQQAKNNKNTYVYAHNMKYDFYTIAPILTKNIKWLSQKPFIADYELQINNKKIKFLDTLNFYPMPLKELAKKIELNKYETPEKLKSKETTEYTPQEKELIIEYCKKDTEIVEKSIIILKDLIKKNNIKIKRLITIQQIAIQYLINKIKEQPKEFKNTFFYNENKNQTIKTYRKQEIHQAYRGGRVEAFQTGIHHNITHIDINSLYPYAATKIKMPNLKTERKIYLKTQNQELIIKAITQIGISKVLLKNTTSNIELIPIRTINGNYYPKKNKYIIGVYTNQELIEALYNGYQIIALKWTIIYQPIINPFKKIIPEIYKHRKITKKPIEKYFYKMMMNASIGKLAQTKPIQELFIDTVEKAKEYTQQNKNNITIIDSQQNNYVYKKESKNTIEKPYYTPIIPTLINAEARIIMHQYLKRIKREHLIYTDTDSIMYKQKYQFKIGEELGEFKIKNVNATINIYGKKTYSIDSEIHIAGTPKRNVTIEEFKQGNIKQQKMITIHTTNKENELGKFKTIKRNLQEETIKQQTIKVKQNKEMLYIDKGIDITKEEYLLTVINNI